MAAQLIHTLFTELIIQNTTAGLNSLQIPEYIRFVMKYIDLHFSEEITLELLADEVNISKYHLSHEFKRYTGLSVKEYLITTRLSYAKDLLKYSEKSVADITEICGIYHVSHFINLFKSREGCTPHTYRKEWKP